MSTTGTNQLRQAWYPPSLSVDSTRAILNKDIISYGLLTAFAKGLQILMLPLLTRLFSPADYGLVDLMATLTGLATILMSLSLESAVARMWHETRDQDQRKRLLTSVMVFVAAFGSVIFGVVWAASGLLSRAITGLANVEAILPMAMCAALLLAIASVPQMVLRMERSIYKFGILQIVNSALGIAFSLALIHFGMGLLGLFLGYLAAAAIVLGLSIRWTRQYLQLRRISRPDLEECLKYSLPLVPAVFLSWSNSQVDRLILLSLLGLGVVGVYGAAAKIAMLITLLVQVFRLAWLPISIRHINESSRDSFFRSSLIGYLAVMTCTGLVLVAYSKELITLLTTSNYVGGYVVIPWLVGAQIFCGSASITNVGMMISKKTIGNSVAAGVGTAINVVLCWFLVTAFGMWGAAIGTFIAAVIFTSLLLWFSQRQVNIPFDICHALGIGIIFVATSAGVLWLYEYSNSYSASARTVLLILALAIVLQTSIKSMRYRVQPVTPLGSA